MSTEKQQNKGFTLIELIIAIAMLAFLMTAVCSFMTSGIVSYKNAKADIRVHNSAQETYDKISDAVMEARDIYLFGYVEGSDDLYCFVRDEDQEKNIAEVESKLGLTTEMGITGADACYFSDISSSSKIYVKALVIDTAVPISESDFASMVPVATGAYKNNLFDYNDPVEISKATKTTVTTNPDGSTSEITSEVKSSSGQQIYTVNDTLRQMFVFNDENMYYMTKYAFATNNDDNYADSSGGKLSDYLYTSSLDTVTGIVTDKTLTNCVAYVDSASGSMSVDLYYSDRNMTYTTNGMINTRNSYVMEAKK